MLIGAQLPGALPRQAAAPGHGAGGHLGADWTPHLPSAAPIACHQVTQGSSRHGSQTNACDSAVPAGPRAMHESRQIRLSCDRLAACAPALVLVVDVASCSSLLELLNHRH